MNTAHNSYDNLLTYPQEAITGFSTFSVEHHMALYSVQQCSEDTDNKVADLRQFVLCYENLLPCNFINNSINVSPNTQHSHKQQLNTCTYVCNLAVHLTGNWYLTL